MQDDGNLYPGWTIPFITENDLESGEVGCRGDPGLIPIEFHSR